MTAPTGPAEHATRIRAALERYASQRTIYGVLPQDALASVDALEAAATERQGDFYIDGKPYAGEQLFGTTASQSSSDAEDTAAALAYRDYLLGRETQKRWAAEAQVAALTEALGYVLDEAVDRWHTSRGATDWAVSRWLGLTGEEYAWYADSKIEKAAASIAARAVLVEGASGQTDTDSGGEQSSPSIAEPFTLTLRWTCTTCGWHTVVDAPGFGGDGFCHYLSGKTACGPLYATREPVLASPVGETGPQADTGGDRVARSEGGTDG